MRKERKVKKDTEGVNRKERDERKKRNADTAHHARVR